MCIFYEGKTCSDQTRVVIFCAENTQIFMFVWAGLVDLGQN